MVYLLTGNFMITIAANLGVHFITGNQPLPRGNLIRPDRTFDVVSMETPMVMVYKSNTCSRELGKNKYIITGF